MKSLIVLVLGLLSVGCLTPEQKQKRLRDSVVGVYESKDKNGVYEYVFLENGVREYYYNGKKQGGEKKWSSHPSDQFYPDEIHVTLTENFEISVWRINKDKSITCIGSVHPGIRRDFPKEDQWTFKKIK